jgi:4-diphosphocytidyl-2-C-methyl-D-erythritol kinase
LSPSLAKRPAGLRLLAPAKVNFTLEVLGKRPDGYHEVRLLMAGVSLFDELSFKPARTLSLTTDKKGLDVGEGNLIIKAARALQKAAGQELGARIHLKKRVPLGGGLAGGSTNAAATLTGLNTLWGLKLKPARLLELAAGLGSDVPFCLRSGWAIATGRGEKLQALRLRRKLWLVLANPGFEVSTQWAYQSVEAIRPQGPNLSLAAFKALEKRQLPSLDAAAVNDLEPVTALRYAEINALKELMLKSGALLSRMSGSGPTVLGLFENEAAAKKAYQVVKKNAAVAVCVHTLGAIPKIRN